MTSNIQPTSHFQLAYAAQVIDQGGVIAYPTEAVFGLGCSPYTPSAIRDILSIKQRPWHKGMILVGSSLEQFLPFIAPLGKALEEQLTAPSDYPTTWLVPAKPELSPLIRGQHDKVAIRISSHPLVQALCEQLGHPIISTSANLAGHSAATSALQVRLQLGQQLDYILNGALGGYHSPSVIKDAQTNQIIRA